MEDGAGPGGNGTLQEGVLVLNRYYVPIRVVTARRAFSLLYTLHAEAVDVPDLDRFDGFMFDAWVRYSERMWQVGRNGATRWVHTPRMILMIPEVVRLLSYARVPKRDVKFNRKNILARDGYRCQYCGKRFAASDLSIDHVVPKSRGGKSIWTNVAASCGRCNTRKGDRMPEEAGMRLQHKPEIPKRNPVTPDRLEQVRHRVWSVFLKDRTFVGA
jgi:5-methylcytosine-specific restriction endonuclease McrA